MPTADQVVLADFALHRIRYVDLRATYGCLTLQFFRRHGRVASFKVQAHPGKKFCF